MVNSANLGASYVHAEGYLCFPAIKFTVTAEHNHNSELTKINFVKIKNANKPRISCTSERHRESVTNIIIDFDITTLNAYPNIKIWLPKLQVIEML